MNQWTLFIILVLTRSIYSYSNRSNEKRRHLPLKEKKYTTMIQSKRRAKECTQGIYILEEKYHATFRIHQLRSAQHEISRGFARRVFGLYIHIHIYMYIYTPLLPRAVCRYCITRVVQHISQIYTRWRERIMRAIHCVRDGQQSVERLDDDLYICIYTYISYRFFGLIGISKLWQAFSLQYIVEFRFVDLMSKHWWLHQGIIMRFVFHPQKSAYLSAQYFCALFPCVYSLCPEYWGIFVICPSYERSNVMKSKLFSAMWRLNRIILQKRFRGYRRFYIHYIIFFKGRCIL